MNLNPSNTSIQRLYSPEITDVPWQWVIQRTDHLVEHKPTWRLFPVQLVGRLPPQFPWHPFDWCFDGLTHSSGWIYRLHWKIIKRLTMGLYNCTVQYRNWSPTANDPETANNPQNGPQMILDRKWSPKSTANDPERKIGMTWTQFSGSSCRFYYYYNKSD